MAQEKVVEKKVVGKDSKHDKGHERQDKGPRDSPRPEKRDFPRGDRRPTDRRPTPDRAAKGGVSFTEAVPASVEEIVGKTGTRGEATQVRCKVLAGRDENKIIRRNVRGPIQLGDILMLRETEIEARALSSAGRGSK